MKPQSHNESLGCASAEVYTGSPKYIIVTTDKTHYINCDWNAGTEASENVTGMTSPATTGTLAYVIFAPQDHTLAR